ncbi:CBS domain-containing protein [Limibaculum sp. M0105]|uniref:CBS domain-containing protein n=2 Tax=Thermohalobaculum xanthum TaxID=2753746 RepID=A0A8J7SDL7_9RHOB|nr:CBS domain-containing protein [Thermohalobaculum xanthum]
MGEMMRPWPQVVPADGTVGDTLARINEDAHRFIVSMSEDEIVGVLDLRELVDLVAQHRDVAQELLGNLSGTAFRICREGDAVEAVLLRMRDADVQVMVVTEEDGTVVGLVLREDMD